MTTANYQLNDEGPERKYFSMIPHLIDDSGLSPYAVRLYLRLKRRTGEGGQCWETTANLASACRMSPATVSRAKRELRDTGLIRISRRDRDHGEFPGHTIEIVDVWVENSRRYSARFIQKQEAFFPGEQERSRSEQERFTGENKEEPKEEKPEEEDPKEKESKPLSLAATATAADCEWILLSDPRINESNNPLPIDDPFIHITILIEFGVNFVDTRRGFFFKERGFPRGYFRVTPTGAKKIKTHFGAELPDRDRLAEAVDFWYWLCQSGKSKLDSLDELLRIYDVNNIIEVRIRTPGIYENSPEVAVVTEITGSKPPKEIMPAIYDVISEAAGITTPRTLLPDLAAEFQEWVSRGQNPKNYIWLFDRFCSKFEIEKPFAYAD